MFLKRYRLTQESWRTEGAVAVEFAISLSVFLLLCLGIIEFGYDWYVKHAMIQAAREGARYGAVYRVKTDGSRLPPAQLAQPDYSSIEEVVTTYLAALVGTDVCTVKVVDNLGYQTGAAGEDLIVQVSCQKTWSALGSLVPALQNLTLTSQSVMKCE
jgi:Flp pilus assembly protein TadG